MIKLTDVTVSYSKPNREPAVPAIDKVSFELEAGTITAILGASGAGKTTLLRCINLLITPTSGAITSATAGNPLQDAQSLQKHRRDTAMIFQKHQLLGRYSALHNVMLGRTGHNNLLKSILPASKADQEMALECLERVGLLDQALQQVQTLSVGQQQRVGVARALCQQAPLMLADEPIASLDPDNAQRILSLLRNINDQDQLTTVVSLHQVEYALAFSDRVIGLKCGKIVVDAKASDLSKEELASLYSPESPANDSIGIQTDSLPRFHNESFPST